jgi:hypothetical protein
MSDFDELILRCKQWLEQGDSIDAVLWRLKERGHFAPTMIKVVIKIQNSSLAEAKRIVHFSPALNDYREYYDRFHEALIEGAREDPDIEVQEEPWEELQ